MRRGGGSEGGSEGERANARSVTPHCAHLPTHPTPKFELESQPRRFPSTRPPSYPLLPSTHSRSPTLFMVNVGRDVSLLVPFVRVYPRPSSFSLTENNKRKEIFAEACVYSCVVAIVFAKIDINVTDDLASRIPLVIDIVDVLVAVLVRHAAKRLDFAPVYSSLSREIGAKARPG